MSAHNDWRMDAMAEFFNAEFVRIGEDGEPMNNTTQDELVERVRLLANWDEGEGLILQGETVADTEMIEDPAAEIVRIVRRAAWREFEAAMLALTDEQIHAAWDETRKEGADVGDGFYDLVRAELRILLASIAPEEETT